MTLYKISDTAPARTISWILAPGYLPAGKVSLLVGDEGIGKSLWAIRALASVSNGRPWGPFTIGADPAPAFLIATEDGLADTIRPRLEVAGANLENIHVLCEDPEGNGSPLFPRDIETLRGSGIRPALVVVDAWVDTVPGVLQVKDPQKTRQAVAPWKTYAAETNAAVVLVTHTNRGERDKLRNTYGLSGALRQVARSALYAAEDAETGDLLVGPEKGNLGALTTAERFVRTPVRYFNPTPQSDGTVPLLDHVGSAGASITEFLAGQESRANCTDRRSDEVDAWLRTVLASGPVETAQLEALGESEGYSSDQLSKSRSRIGARAIKSGGRWSVELPRVQGCKGADAEHGQDQSWDAEGTLRDLEGLAGDPTELESLDEHPPWSR